MLHQERKEPRQRGVNRHLSDSPLDQRKVKYLNLYLILFSVGPEKLIHRATVSFNVNNLITANLYK